jgi:hypothetical protein
MVLDAAGVISRSHLARKILQLLGSYVGGNVVPRYLFVVQRGDQQRDPDRPTMILPNDAEALRYAESMIAELQKEKGYRDPAGFIVVRNEENETILSVPFLPACA